GDVMMRDNARMLRPWLYLGVAALLLLGAIGCRGTGTVTGKIKLKDKGQETPLGGGIVVFMVADRGSATGLIQEDGSYKVEKVPVGKATITVETKSVAPTEVPKGRSGMRGDMQFPLDKMPESAGNSPLYAGQGPKKGTYVKIPDRYNDPKASGLTYDVQSGPQEHDIELTP